MTKSETVHRFILQVMHSVYLTRTQNKKDAGISHTTIINVDEKTLLRFTSQMSAYCNIIIHKDNPSKVQTVYQDAIRVHGGYKKRISKIKNTPINICVMPYTKTDPDVEETKKIIASLSKKDTLVLFSSAEAHTGFQSLIINTLYDPELTRSKLETVATTILQQSAQLTEHNVKILLVPDTHTALHGAEQYVVPSDYESFIQVLMLHDLVKNHAAEGPFLTFETPCELNLKINGRHVNLNINDEYKDCSVMVLDSPLNSSRGDRSMFQDQMRKLIELHKGKTFIIACSFSSMQKIMRDLVSSTKENMDAIEGALHVGMLFGLICHLIQSINAD